MALNSDQVSLSLTSYEAATLHLLAAIGLDAYERDEISEMTRELVDRIPPIQIHRLMEKISAWPEVH